MRKFLSPRRFLHSLLFLALIPLLGMAPRQQFAGQAIEAARLAAKKGDPGKATLLVAEAAEHAAVRADLWELAGQYAWQAQDLRQAEQYLERAGQAGALSAGGWSRLSEVHHALADFPAALADLQILAALQPGDARLRYQIGLLTATHDPEAALAHLVQAVEMDDQLAPRVEALRGAILSARIASDPAYSLLAAGRGLASLEKWDLAAEAFHQATIARPNWAEAWAYLGEARQHVSNQSGRSDIDRPGLSGAGWAELQKALALDPRSLAAYTFLALYWQRQGQYEQAVDALSAALAIEPRNPILHIEHGRNLALQGDLNGAAQAYGKAVTLAPHDLSVLSGLIDFSLRYDYQVREMALPTARHALNSDPGGTAPLDLMAQVLIRLGDLDSAGRFLQRAVQANPAYAPAHLHLGLVYLLQGGMEAAYQELAQALSISPTGAVGEQAGRLIQTHFP